MEATILNETDKTASINQNDTTTEINIPEDSVKEENQEGQATADIIMHITIGRMQNERKYFYVVEQPKVKPHVSQGFPNLSTTLRSLRRSLK